jgi:hypothetical protein
LDPFFCLDFLFSSPLIIQLAAKDITKQPSNCSRTSSRTFTYKLRLQQIYCVTMSPVTPHWTQPSHPEVQDVIINEAAFTTKSYSRVTVPPFGVFAKLAFPPCTDAYEPTYATVQTGRNTHLNLNSDLLYINHSCEPSLVSENNNNACSTPPFP